MGDHMCSLKSECECVVGQVGCIFIISSCHWTSIPASTQSLELMGILKDGAFSLTAFRRVTGVIWSISGRDGCADGVGVWPPWARTELTKMEAGRTGKKKGCVIVIYQP